MPELPDLQVFSQNLTRRLKGKKVKTVSLKNSRKSKVTGVALNRALAGAMLTAVRREGKELHFDFSNGHVLGLHLMLRGQLTYYQTANEKRFPIVEILFHDGSGLAMVDFQGQANVALNPVVKASPDAMSKQVNFKFLKDKFSRSKAAVKSVLLDQDFVRGIGNAYADEILYDCGISPFSVSHQIPDEKIKSLLRSIRSVLKRAEKQIKKADPDIIAGELRDFLAVHNSKRKTTDDGERILVKTVGGRKTYYTKSQIQY